MLNLPAELTLNILSYLPFISLSRLQAVCKSWKEFCNFHESNIYRNAACLHSYIPCPTTMLNELLSLYSQRVLEGVNTWKDFCRKRWEIQRNWKGKGPSAVIKHRSTCLRNHQVHRIKVDELAGYIMTTSSNGGLLVTDLNKDRILWALPEWYVSQYAHLEYGQGYMIFNRHSGDKEVWRCSSDISEHVVDESSTPDVPQREVYEILQSSTMDRLFRPWAVLHMPEPTSAFRFVYPTLIVAAYDRVYLWDVPSGKLVQTIQGCQVISSENGDNHHLRRIVYVEISERHVFLVGQFYLRIFSRATGKSILDLSSSSEGRYGLWMYVLANSHGRMSGSALVRYEMVSTRGSLSEKKFFSDQFVSVHVSACGCHFAALLRGGHLLVAYNFEKASNKEELHGQTLDIYIDYRHESIYLAFDYGRISVVATNGVFIFEVDESSLANISTEAPILTVSRVFRLTDLSSLYDVSCLMLSDTGLYLNWNPDAMNPDEYEESFEPRSQDVDAGLVNSNMQPVMPDLEDEPQAEPSISMVFSVNFARC